MFLFVSVFSEVYGLYLNKTVGCEQSILRVCVCVCVFAILCLWGPIQTLKVRTFRPPQCCFNVNVRIRITIKHVFVMMLTDTFGAKHWITCIRVRLGIVKETCLYTFALCAFALFVKVYILYAFVLACISMQVDVFARQQVTTVCVFCAAVSLCMHFFVTSCIRACHVLLCLHK